MLLQERLIERVRVVCREDDAIRAAIMYGSFAQGEGDAYSDIEFVLFIDDDALAALDKRDWLERIAPLAICCTNEFGITAVIFENLVRGEFHFDRASELHTIAAGWRGAVWFPSLESTLIVDKTGELTQYLEPLIGEPLQHGTTHEEVQAVTNRFINWFLFGIGVLERGEEARALELLWFVQRHLLMMARVLEDSTVHWPTPSRLLEHDLSTEAYERYRRCTGALDTGSLWRAYANAWAWATEMLPALSESREVMLPGDLLARIAARCESRP